MGRTDGTAARGGGVIRCVAGHLEVSGKEKGGREGEGERREGGRGEGREGMYVCTCILHGICVLYLYCSFV